MISEIVQEFCDQYGLTGISMEEEGSLRLTIDGIGDFQLLHKKFKLLAGLSRKVENPYLLSGRKILQCCHFSEPHLKPIHATLYDNNLVLFYAFDENEVSAALLSQALDSLTETMDRVL